MNLTPMSFLRQLLDRPIWQTQGMPCRSRLLSTAAMILGSGLCLCCASAWSADGGVSARSVTVKVRFSAYAQVVPIAVAHLRAAQSGRIRDLNVEQGQHVAAGATLGRLTGSQFKARLAQRRADAAAAQAGLKAAKHTLAIQKQKRASHLSTREAVYRAQAALTQARSKLSAAQAALEATQDNAVLRAPQAGTVISLAAADGERVTAGQTLLTLQPDHHLWLKATYYGRAANHIHPGMLGQFRPADGSTPIAVQVARLVPVAQPGGGRPVALRARGKDARWVSGEAGKVILKGAQQTAMEVPTRALILDRSQWWVLVHTGKGDRRQRVTLGASRGDDTLITQGLSAGSQVVVDNAYLKFHRDFSQHYQPPD